MDNQTFLPKDPQTAAPSQTRWKNIHQELHTKQAESLEGVAYRTAIQGSVHGLDELRLLLWHAGIFI